MLIIILIYTYFNPDNSDFFPDNSDIFYDRQIFRKWILSLIMYDIFPDTT